MQYQQKIDNTQGLASTLRRPINKGNHLPFKNACYQNNMSRENIKDNLLQGNHSSMTQSGEYIPLRYPAYRIADIAQGYPDQEHFSHSGMRSNLNAQSKDKNFRGNRINTIIYENQHLILSKFNDTRKTSSKEGTYYTFSKDGHILKRTNPKGVDNNNSMSQEPYTISIKKHTGTNIDKQSNEIDNSYKSHNKVSFRNQLKLPTTPSLQNITEEDKFNLHMAILGLYKDRIQPNIIEIRYKLNEASNNIINLEQFLVFYLSHESLYEVKINEGKIENIHLRSTPPWFKGWVDIKNPSNCFPQSTWKHFLSFLKEKRPLIPMKEGPNCKYDARYKLVQEFRKYESSLVKNYSLGELYHFIELSILNGILTYENDYIIPSFSSKWIAYSIIDPEILSLQADLPTDLTFITDLHYLCQMIVDLIISSSQGFIYLSKLKLKLYQKYKIVVNPSFFKFSTLEELISYSFADQVILECYQSHLILMLNQDFYTNTKKFYQDPKKHIQSKIKSRNESYKIINDENISPNLYKEIKCINTPEKSIVMDHWIFSSYIKRLRYQNSSLIQNSLPFYEELETNLRSEENHFQYNKDLDSELLDGFTSTDLSSNTIDLLRLPKSFSNPGNQTEGSIKSQLANSNQRVFQLIYLKNDACLPDVITLISHFTDTYLDSDFKRLLKYYSNLVNFSAYQFPLDSNTINNLGQYSSSKLTYNEQEYYHILSLDNYSDFIDHNIFKQAEIENNCAHTNTQDIQYSYNAPDKQTYYHTEDQNLDKPLGESFLVDCQKFYSLTSQSDGDVLKVWI